MGVSSGGEMRPGGGAETVQGILWMLLNLPGSNVAQEGVHPEVLEDAQKDRFENVVGCTEVKNSLSFDFVIEGGHDNHRNLDGPLTHLFKTGNAIHCDRQIEEDQID